MRHGISSTAPSEAPTTHIHTTACPPVRLYVGWYCRYNERINATGCNVSHKCAYIGLEMETRVTLTCEDRNPYVLLGLV